MKDLFCRRIWSIDDIHFIIDGMNEGIEIKVFSKLGLMDKLRLLCSKDTTFYIFGYVVREHFVRVGFGAIRNEREVHKVFVSDEFRGEKIGIRISLWIKQQILERHNRVPMCYIKKLNNWGEAMRKQGMEKKNYTFEVDEYVLRDWKQFAKALEKYKIDKIEYLKKE